jgi:hypothetical protein
MASSTTCPFGLLVDGKLERNLGVFGMSVAVSRAMETSIPTVKTSLVSGGLRLIARRVGTMLAAMAVKVEQEFVRGIVAVVFFVFEALLLLDERLVARYFARRQPAKVTRRDR